MGRRDGGTEGWRDGGTEGRRDGGTEGRKEGGGRSDMFLSSLVFSNPEAAAARDDLAGNVGKRRTPSGPSCCFLRRAERLTREMAFMNCMR